MKKIIYAAVLLLGLSALSSCKKDSDLRETIPGTWKVSTLDFSYDGQKLDINLDTDYLWAQEKDEVGLTCFWMPRMKTEISQPLEFEADGTVTVSGRMAANWEVVNGKLKIEPVGPSPLGEEETIVDVVDGKIRVAESRVVLSYLVSKDARIPESLDADSKTHILELSITLEKIK